MALSPPFVPVSLAPPVSFRPCRIVLKQLCPVVRVLSAPLLHALQTSLAIHRIGGDLPSVFGAREIRPAKRGRDGSRDRELDALPGGAGISRPLFPSEPTPPNPPGNIKQRDHSKDQNKCVRGRFRYFLTGDGDGRQRGKAGRRPIARKIAVVGRTRN